MSARAVDVLRSVDRIAAEDTRHSRTLLTRFDIRRPLISFHEHNEQQQEPYILRALEAGESVAVISDAGTPLISDPGYRLVRHALETGIRVVPVPGPSAMMAALSVCGLPTDRFTFEGFLPAKSGPRQKRLQELATESRTLVFYASAHRIVPTLEDMATALGGEREATLARELTKVFETVRLDRLGRLAQWVAENASRQKGEFVLVVRGVAPTPLGQAEADRLLGVLLDELPVKRAAAVAARLTGRPSRELYKRAVELARPPS